MLHKKLSPNVCQNVSVVKPKIFGISQFHSHITGSVNKNEANTLNNSTVAKVSKKIATYFFSINFAIIYSISI